MHIDSDLLQKCVNNDRRAQKTLYEWCFRSFMPVCVRYHKNEEDARSSLNTAFVKIIKALTQTDLKELNLFAWSKRIVTNVLIDEYRKNKLHQTHYIAKESDRDLEILSINSTNEAESNFGYDVLIKLVEELPEMHGLVFKLYVMEDMGHKDIAEQLSISEGTSKWHLSIARKMLREKLEKLESYALKRMVI